MRITGRERRLNEHKARTPATPGARGTAATRRRLSYGLGTKIQSGNTVRLRFRLCRLRNTASKARGYWLEPVCWPAAP